MIHEYRVCDENVHLREKLMVVVVCSLQDL